MLIYAHDPQKFRNYASYPHMLDETDNRILGALQRNANLTAQELSEQLNLSASQIGRRRQRLETDGYIVGYSARINPSKLGLSVQGFVQVHLSTHGPDHSASFARLVNTQQAITGAWTMTGDADYLLRVYCSDLSALNTLIHEVLLPHPAVARVHSQIVMDQLKRDGPLPT
jgi:DNA-binding Lrp family transcriptional regulator